MPFNDENFIKEFAGIVTGLKIKSALETGHGSGELVTALRETGIDARGIDKSTELLRVAPAPHFITMALEKFISKKKFDLVYSSGVLGHYAGAGDVEFIRQMAALSKKYVINFVPNADCAAYRGAKKRTMAAWKGEKDYTADSLKAIHEAAGLTVIEAGMVGGAWAKRWGPEPSLPYLVYVIAVK